MEHRWTVTRGFTRRKETRLSPAPSDLFKTTCAALAAMAVLASCGAEPASRFKSDDALGQNGRDRIVNPPKAYYDALLLDRMQLANAGAMSKAAESVLWVNFAGASVNKGYDLGQSFLACKNTVKIPPAPLSSTAQQAVLNQVATYFSNAGAKVAVVSDQPTSGEYTTMHVGGSYANLGCSGGSPVGIAPFDAGNANPSDVGFVFPQSNDVETLARTIAHEAAHTYGLEHADNKDDLMYPWDLQSAVGFATGMVAKTGMPQDPAALLQAALGSGLATVSGIPVPPTMQVPVVNLPQVQLPGSFANLPGNLAQLPGLANFANLSGILNLMPMALNGAMACVMPNITVAGVPVNVALQNSQGALGLLTILLNASVGQNSGQFTMLQLMGLISGYPTMNIAQLISLAGVSMNATQCLSQLIPVSIPGITGTLPGQLPTGINVAQILAMQNVTNPGQLIAMIPQYAQVIGVSAQGPQAQAMMSLVLMAVAQQYQSIPMQP